MIRRILTLVILISVLIAAAVFASVNTDVIVVDFLFDQYELPQSIVIIGALIVGTLIGLLSASIFVVRFMTERRKLRKALRNAETEISSLRSLPLHDAS
ncbi:MAG: LapA family protein [Pseudomonadota bacterium]